MCTHSKEYQKLLKEGKTPKDECKKCPDSETCGYQTQLKQLASFKQSTEGFCILTTEKNLNNKAISEVMVLLNPILIIDDISLSSVVLPELEVKVYVLESLVQHLQKQGPKATHLHALVSRLCNFKKGNENDIISYIADNESPLNRELRLFQTDHEGKESLPSHPALSFISRLIYAVKHSDRLTFYSENNLLKIVSDETSKFNHIRICYLNATPSLKDEYCIEQLGDYHHLKGKVEQQKKYVVFQIVDSATTKQAIRDSERMRTDVKELTNVIRPTLGFTEQKLLIFGHDDVLKEWGKSDVFSGIDSSFEIYFGSGTRGTNEYKDYPISFVLGTPYYPPEYFLYPAFKEHWDRKTSDHEAKINLLQMIGRNLRDSPTNPKAVKVVVVFTSIDIAKECQEQNGGTVFKTNIRREIPIMQGKRKGKTPFFDAYKKASQAALKPRIKRSIEEHIDKLIEQNPSEPLALHRIAEVLQKRIKIYDVEGTKTLIKEIYKTESKFIERDGKKVNTAFITHKKPI